mgnify:CR=1 FL=1
MVRYLSCFLDIATIDTSHRLPDLLLSSQSALKPREEQIDDFAECNKTNKQFQHLPMLTQRVLINKNNNNSLLKSINTEHVLRKQQTLGKLESLF